MKFSTVDGTQGPLRRAKFHDNRYHTNFNTGIFAGKETFSKRLMAGFTQGSLQS